MGYRNSNSQRLSDIATRDSLMAKLSYIDGGGQTSLLPVEIDRLRMSVADLNRRIASYPTTGNIRGWR